MRVLRRYALLVAALVFVASGPLGAWHVASEVVPAPHCHASPRGATIFDAHHLASTADGPDCLACHLLQHVRGRVPVVAGLADRRARASRATPSEQSPLDLVVADLLPARAPPPALT